MPYSIITYLAYFRNFVEDIKSAKQAGLKTKTPMLSTTRPYIGQKLHPIH